MKSILVCDDNQSYMQAISLAAKMLEKKAEIVLAYSLRELLERAADGKKFDFIFLDGILGNNETSTPFIRNLLAGSYPHLSGTHLYLMSSDDQLRLAQSKLAGAIPHTHWTKGANFFETVEALAEK